MRPLRLALPLVLALVLASCADEVGVDGRQVGGPCRDNFDCGSGSFCLEGGEFPGGTCTERCFTDATDCVGASACIDRRGGVCLLTCGSELDCREGYACREETLLAVPGTTTVCIAE